MEIKKIKMNYDKFIIQVRNEYSSYEENEEIRIFLQDQLTRAIATISTKAIKKDYNINLTLI